MSFLAKGRKSDLIELAAELGIEASVDSRVVDLKKLIITSKDYDEEFTKGMLDRIIEERVKKEDSELEERDKLRAYELEKLKIKNDSKPPISETKTTDLRNFIHKYDINDGDISTYLTLFERQAKRMHINEEDYVTHLVCLLPYEVMQIIAKESDDVANNYLHIKSVLLKHFKLSPEKFRQKFINHVKELKCTWKDFVFEIRNYFNEWLTGLKINDFDALKELMITEQLKKKVPHVIRDHYIDNWAKYINANELAEKLDDYDSVRQEFKKVNTENFRNSGKLVTDDYKKDKYNEKWKSNIRFGSCNNYPNSLQRATDERVVTENVFYKSKPNCNKPASENACYNCYEKGHYSRDCPKPKRNKVCTNCKKEGHGTKDCPLKSSALVNAATSPSVLYKLYDTTKDITINKTNVPALMDTAADISMIKISLANKIDIGLVSNDVKSIRGIGGGIRKSFKTIKTKVVIDNVVLDEVKLHVVPDDTFVGPDVLIGNDIIDSPDLVMVRKEGKSKLLYVSECDFLKNIQIDETSQRVVLRTPEKVILKPYSVQLVTVISDDENQNGFMSSYRHDELNTALMINDGKTMLPMVNTSNENLKLKKNQVIARGNMNEYHTEDHDSPVTAHPETSIVLVTKEIVKEPINYEEIKVGPDITNEQRQCLCNLLNEFRHCFAKTPDELGCFNNVAMHITEEPGSKPVVRAPYRASRYEREILRDIIDELKQQGVIRDSMSEYSSPVLLVSKKTGEYRMVIDYRQLNSQTVKDKFPLPCIDDLLDRLSGFKIFCVLDACQGFNQIPMDDESSRKAAFTTPDGHYEPTRLFFGLTNGPSVFQRAMSLTLGDLLWKFATCFIDDIFFGAHDFEDMIIKLRQVLEKLLKAGVALKLSKCEFGMTEVQYLGFVVSKEGIRPGSRKLSAIAEFPTPKTKHEVRRFLGLASFFRRFIEHYASVAAPLTYLLKKNQLFSWTEKQQNAFEELRSKLISKPVLKLFDPRDETELHTDASSTGIAGMLLQRDKTNALRLVYCVSRRTHPNEEKYHSSRLELIAATWSMVRLRPLLLGIEFTLVTDCSAVTYLNTQKNIKPHIARLAEQISEFNFKVKHRSHERMKHIDALSRAPVEERDDTPVQEIEFTSPVELTVSPKVYYTVSEEDRVALIQAQDKELQRIIVILRKPIRNRTLAEKQLTNSYELINSILYRTQEIDKRQKKLFVMPKTMRKYLAVRFHDFSGHFGTDKVVKMIREQFWFPRMTSYVKQHIRQCITCAYTKVPAGKVQGKLNPIPPGNRPFEIVHMDFLGPFVSSSSRNKELLVFVDNLTKFIRIRACKSCSTTYVLKHLDEFTEDFGCPKRIVTDRGSCFTSSAFEDYCNKYGIKHTLTSSQRPQANGQVERINRILIPRITSTVRTESHKDWDRLLPEIQRTINWSPSKSTGKAPFELLYGYKPTKPGYFPSELLPAEQDYTPPDQVHKEIVDNINTAQKKMKTYYDSRHCDAFKYSVGDVVVIRRLPEQTGSSTKTQVKYRGPLVVMKVLPSDTYEVTDFREAGQGRKRRQNYTTTAHASQMKLFHLINEDLSDDDDSGGDDDEPDASVPNELAEWQQKRNPEFKNRPKRTVALKTINYKV